MKYFNYYQSLRYKLQKFFKPEFLNRLSEIIRFEHLNQNDIYNLVDIETKKFVAKLKQSNTIDFVMSDDARKYIAEQGYSRKYGARFLKRFFEKHIEAEIATLIIKSKGKPEKITCNTSKNKLIFETCA